MLARLAGIEPAPLPSESSTLSIELQARAGDLNRSEGGETPLRGRTGARAYNPRPPDLAALDRRPPRHAPRLQTAEPPRASRRVLRDRLRHLQLGRRDRRRRTARRAWSNSSPATARCRRPCSTLPRAPETHGPPRAFGRAAIAAYVDGLDGRLMRSMKSILGSSLVEQTTDVGGGRGVKYLDVDRRLPEAPEDAGRGAGRRADRARRARPPGVLRRRRPGARRAGAGRAGRGRARRRLQRAELPVRADRRRVRLRAHGASASRSCSWPTSAAARRTSRSCASGPSARAGSSARTTSWPTTACTSPAPTSTAASSSPACWASSATARSARRSTARRRARCRARCTSTSRPGT